MTFNELFASPKPLIAVIHLLPLPGAPRYDGHVRAVYDAALREAEIFTRNGVDGLLVENFRDMPFYPDRLPPESVAALAAVTREVVKSTSLPVGVNALRNDAEAALAVATACEAHFMRVNVHLDVAVSDQGLLQGAAHQTMRLRAALRSNVLVFADVAVKHAAPLRDRGLAVHTRDLTERGLADGIIVSGAYTGAPTPLQELDLVRQNTRLPVLIGSGVTPENLPQIAPKVDGLIVGSYFKQGGNAEEVVDETRVKRLVQALRRTLAGG